MKTVKMILTTVIVLLTIQFSNAQFQFANNSMSPELQEKVLMVNLMLAADGFEIGDTYNTSIDEGTTKIIRRRFSMGNDYAIIAVSEAGVLDLDMTLTDLNGRTFAKDTASNDGGVALIEKQIFNTQTLKIKVKNYEAYNSYVGYDTVIIVAYK